MANSRVAHHHVEERVKKLTNSVSKVLSQIIQKFTINAPNYKILFNSSLCWLNFGGPKIVGPWQISTLPTGQNGFAIPDQLSTADH
jgi:hypothetical protein